MSDGQDLGGVQEETTTDRESRSPASSDEALGRLRDALDEWRIHSRPRKLIAWFDRELDADGVAPRLDLPAWLSAFQLMHEALMARPTDWPDDFDARVEPWFRWLLRVSRPDGTPATGPREGHADPRKVLREWSSRLSDPGFSTVLDWWFPRSAKSVHAPPPLPAATSPGRVLSVLRANWARDGDFLAVDHRDAGVASSFELVAGGVPWLGPEWSSLATSSMTTKAVAEATLWQTNSMADIAEWSVRLGKSRILRTAVLLRGRKLALLAEGWEGPGDPGGWSLRLASDVKWNDASATQARRLQRSKPSPAPWVLPIGLPRSDLVPEAGGLTCEESRLVLRQTGGPARSWRPLLLSWDGTRDRKALTWRTLTVTEDRRVCTPDEAFAARVSWGRDETLLVYRSLGPPARRAMLGHQTTARFLIGLFNAEGDIEPLLKIDE